MSSADRAAVRRPARCAGYTMIELSISMLAIAGMTLILTTTSYSTGQADHYLTAVGHVTERSQKTLYDIANAIESSRRFFQADDVGQGYLDALDLASNPLAPGSRLPLVDEQHPLGADLAGDPRTGNVLLVVAQGSPAPCVADANTGELVHVDLHRFVCLYTTQTTRTVLPGAPPARDFVVWRSLQYPDHDQLMAITDATQRRSVVRDLHDRFGLDVAWDAGSPADGSFYRLDTTGSIDAAPLSAHTIEEDPTVSARGRLVYANMQLARTEMASYERRPVLTRDPPGLWAPHGFEVKAAGTAGSRQVWTHLVIEKQAEGSPRVAVIAGTLTSSSQDY